MVQIRRLGQLTISAISLQLWVHRVGRLSTAGRYRNGTGMSNLIVGSPADLIETHLDSAGPGLHLRNRQSEH